MSGNLDELLQAERRRAIRRWSIIGVVLGVVVLFGFDPPQEIGIVIGVVESVHQVQDDTKHQNKLYVRLSDGNTVSRVCSVISNWTAC